MLNVAEIVSAVDEDETLLKDQQVITALESFVIGWDDHISKQIDHYLGKVCQPPNVSVVKTR